MALVATHSLKKNKSQSNSATFTVPGVYKKKAVSTTSRLFCVRGTRTQPLIWVSYAVNRHDCLRLHLPRFEALAYVVPHFDALTRVVIRGHAS